MNANDDATFGLWLKERRKALDLTQEELADRTGCSPWTITKIETGERRPSRQLAELLSEQLQIPDPQRAEFVALARKGQALHATPGGSAASRPGSAASLQRRSVMAAPPHNVPTPLTSTIGRDTELAALRGKLLDEEVRLITLTGPPGIGKTRLAIEVARSMLSDFEDGVFFVPLASISDPGLVLSAIAQALDVGEPHSRSAADGLAQALRHRHLLLVLDNFEQLVDAGPLIGDLLRACPRLRALVTSREALRVRGEQQFQVLPLGLPRSPHDASVEELASYPSVELFRSRARAVKGDFDLNRANATTVAAICTHLDGLPLAIELVAAHIRLLPPWALLARLGSGFEALLTNGLRDAPERHRTLSAAIGWSYDLLTEEEQQMLCRLSVFPAGCTLEGAEAIVAMGNDDVLGALESLMHKSLLQRAEPRGREEPRYVMLQTIRDYALERLAERGEEDIAMPRLVAYYLRLAQAAEPNLTGPEQKEWLDRLESEHDNFRAALSWLTSRRDELALKMVLSLWYFWEIRGYLSEGRRWLDETLANTDASLSPERARVLHVAAGLALRQGDYERARTLSRESLSISRSLDDKQGTGRSLHALGICQEALGNLEAAEECYRESLAIWRELGHSANLGRTLNSLGVLARARGEYERAVELFNESLDLHRQSGRKRSMALALANLGSVALLRNNWEEARELFIESLDLRREIGHKVGIGDCLIGLAGVYAATGNPLKAARLFGAGKQLFRSMDYEMEPSDRKVFERSVEMARSRSDCNEFNSALAQGEAMDADEAIAYALG